MARPKKDPILADDLADLPEDIAAAMQREREILAIDATHITHTIYRYTDTTTTSPKEIVGRVPGSPENPLPPDDHDVGQLVRRAGLYTIQTRVSYRNANNKIEQKVFWANSFRIGPEYEKPPTPATQERAAHAENAGIQATLEAFDKFADIMVKVRGGTPTPPAADVQALEGALQRLQRESDRRFDRLQQEHEDEIERLRRRLKTEPEEGPKEALTPGKATEWVEAGGRAVRAAVETGKSIMDAFKPAAEGKE